MSTPRATAEFSLYRTIHHYGTVANPRSAAGAVNRPTAGVLRGGWLDDCIETCESLVGPDAPPGYPSTSGKCRAWCLEQGPPPPEHPSCLGPDRQSCIWPLSYGRIRTECCPTTHTCCMHDTGYSASTYLRCCAPGYKCCDGTCCPPGMECCGGKCYWATEHQCSPEGQLCPVGRTICYGECCGENEECVDNLCTPRGQVWCNGSLCTGRCIPNVGDPSGAKVCCPPGRQTEAGCCPSNRPICGGSCCSNDEACGRGACCKIGVCCENAPCKPGYHCCHNRQCCPNNRVCGPIDPVTGDIRCLRP